MPNDNGAAQTTPQLDPSSNIDRPQQTGGNQFANVQLDPSTNVDRPTEGGGFQGGAGMPASGAGGGTFGTVRDVSGDIGTQIGNFFEGLTSKYIPQGVRDEFHRVIAGGSQTVRDMLTARQRTQPAYSSQLNTVPQQYRQTVLDAANEYKLDPKMIAAIMIQENAQFNPRAQGGAQERGLMQITPGTWRGLTRSENNPQGENFDLAYDPETNIRMGSKLLRQLLDQHGQDWHEAIVHYNANKNTPAGERYYQQVMSHLGRTQSTEHEPPDTRTAGLRISPALTQMLEPSQAPEAQAEQEQTAPGEQSEAPRDWSAGPSGTSEPEAPAQPQMKEESLSDLVNRVTGHPDYKGEPITATHLARGLIADPALLLKAAAQGIAHANPLYQAIGGKEWPLGRTDPESILEAGGRVASDMLVGGEAATGESTGETAAAEPGEAAAIPAAPAAAEEPGEQFTSGFGEPARPAAPAAPARAPAARARAKPPQRAEIPENLEAKLAKLYQEALQEHLAERAAQKTAPPEEDLTKKLQLSLPRPEKAVWNITKELGAKVGDQVRLRDIRSRMSKMGYSDAQVDKAITNLQSEGSLTAIPLDLPGDITPEDRAAQIDIGGVPRQAVVLRTGTRGK